MGTEVSAFINVRNKQAIAKLNQTGQAFNKLKSAVAPAAGIAIGAGLAFKKLTDVIGTMSGVASEFEQSFTAVTTLLDQQTFDKFGDDLKTGALETMSDFGFTIRQTNKALFDAISAGVSAGDAFEFMDEASRLAIAGVTDISVSVDGLTSVMNAYGKANFDAAKASNIFFIAQKFGKTTVQALASNIGKVAPIASKMNVSFSESASAMAQLTLSGLSTEEATVALRQTIASLIKPSSQAQKKFKQLGINIRNTQGNFRSFGDIMADVRDETGGNVETLAELFPNIRALTGVTALAGEGLNGYNKILQQTRNDTESSTAAFKCQQNTFSQQSKILSANLQVAFVQVGEVLNKALAPVVKAITTIIKTFNRAPKIVKVFTVALIVATAAFAGLVAVLALAKLATIAWAAAMTFATGGLNLIIPAIAAVVAALFTLYHTFKDTLEPFLSPVLEPFINSMKIVWEVIKNVYFFAGQLYTALFSLIKPFAKLVKDSGLVQKIFQGILKAALFIVPPIRIVVTLFNILRGLVKKVSDRFKTMENFIKSLKITFLNWIISSLKGIVKLVGAIGLLALSFKQLPGNIKIARASLESMKNIQAQLVDLVKQRKALEEGTTSQITKRDPGDGGDTGGLLGGELAGGAGGGSAVQEKLAAFNELQNQFLLNQINKEREYEATISEIRESFLRDQEERFAQSAQNIGIAVQTGMVDAVMDGTNVIQAAGHEFSQGLKRTLIAETFAPIQAAAAKFAAKMLSQFARMFGGPIGGLVSALGFQDGGIVPGSGRGDKVPAMLEPGELVVNRNVTDKLLKNRNNQNGENNVNNVINNNNNFNDSTDIEFFTRKMDRLLSRSLR